METTRSQNTPSGGARAHRASDAARSTQVVRAPTAPSKHAANLGGVTPDATARLIALPDTLRSWAREDPVVHLHLAAHVHGGLQLGHVLGRLADTLGEGGEWEVRVRMQARIDSVNFHPRRSRLPF